MAGSAPPVRTLVDPVAAIRLADELLEESRRLQSRAQKRQALRLGRLTGDPASLDFTLALADEVTRMRDPSRAVRRLGDLLSRRGAPPGFGPLDRLLIHAAVGVGQRFPESVSALLRRRIRREASSVVLPAEGRRLARHLTRRRRDGFGLNVNLLGEAILGDDESARRLSRLLDHVRRPDIDYVSVKASALCARLSTLAFEHSVERVAAILRLVLVEAAKAGVFVNLDMEEYRDLALTLAGFMRALDEPEVAAVDAGIVLQAYLPDAHNALEELAAWAQDRHQRGGGHVRVRVVKGANLAMERVDAELHGWAAAPYPTKLDVDASYKRLLARALDPGWGDALRVGVASHNLYDVAWALLLAASLGTEGRLEVEMLEGMAPGQAQAVRRRGTPVRLYVPVVSADEFDSAVAYLARRLDENSGPENYLHRLLSGRLDAEPSRFVASVAHAVPTRSRRDQDRTRLEPDPPPVFANASDTDWSSASNRAWIGRHLSLRTWALCGAVHSEDPSRPEQSLYSFDMTDGAGVDRAVATAARAARPNPGARATMLLSAASVLARRRGELIAAMVADAGKIVSEADVEVSEAVDYAAYYASRALAIDRRDAVHSSLGIVVVAPPWNFPLAIPLGGALAAIAAGNSVILKPAPETVLTAWLGVRCLWEAGIPPELLQLVPCPDDDVGRRLVTHPRVDAVVLTGSYDTAMMFLDWRPDLHLLAETSGKNAIVVTAAADIDLAVGDIVSSAFGHAGQKCSAASLVIVEASLLDEGRFTRKLSDATRTLVVGSAEEPATEVGPLIHPPGDALRRALTRLEPGEQWLVTPRQLSSHLWTPGIRTGVAEGSWFHRTECFGPVLGIMTATDVDHALGIVSATGYGLTVGLQSLDPREIRRFVDRAEVGNIYVNRPITGAVVRRQPFGGWKRSSVGPTAKAGGPNYVAALCRWEDTRPDRLDLARTSYPQAWTRLRSGEDPSALASEINVLRHRALERVALRVESDADPNDVELCRLAASVTGVELVEGNVAPPVEGCSRLRVLGTPSVEILRAAHGAGLTVDRRRPVADGEIEMPRWAREQSVSITAHRYGRPVNRAALGLQPATEAG